MTPLHPHQHAALVAELRRPDYDGKSADEAFALLGPPLDSGLAGRYAPKNLTRIRFVPAAKVAAMRKRGASPKQLATLVPVAGDFPTGVPGFPNKVMREWFDAAWTEVRGG